MVEKTRDEKSSKNLIIILLLVIILLLIAGGIILFFFLNQEDEADAQLPDNGGLVQYDNAAVALDADSLKSQYKDALKAAEGTMALKYQNEARSSDGTNFSCYIGNSEANEYDMYANIYLDTALTEQVLLTGLIPPGSGIMEFESEIPLEPGTYDTVLVLTQVEDDHSTFHAQLMVALTLVVEE